MTNGSQRESVCVYCLAVFSAELDEMWSAVAAWCFEGECFCGVRWCACDLDSFTEAPSHPV